MGSPTPENVLPAIGTPQTIALGATVTFVATTAPLNTPGVYLLQAQVLDIDGISIATEDVDVTVMGAPDLRSGGPAAFSKRRRW